MLLHEWWWPVNDETYYPRIADDLLRDKLSHAGAVVIRGPKWCGKTRTALQQCKSVLYMQDPDQRESNLFLAETKPSVLLRGEKPRLIDEWQEAPQLWDAARFSIDRGAGAGSYVFTGSATPREKPMHSGTGRMSFLSMRPMTLFESKESTAEVSLAAMFEGGAEPEGYSSGDVETVAYQVARGGWPGAVTMPDKRAALETAFDYISAVAEEDISDVDGVRRNPEHARLVMRAYARCCGTQTSVSAMSKTIGAQGGEMTRQTFTSYIEALRKLSMVEDLSAWMPSLRAKTRVTRTPKRFFVDPSLSVAALGASPDLLLRDMPTLGMLFEGMCVRDLRSCMDKLQGEVMFYHDDAGAEADAVLVLRDGRWALVEIKLSAAQTENAAKSLKKVAERIDASIMGKPSFLMVITSGGYAYRRNDGVLVVPISCLAP